MSLVAGGEHRGGMHPQFEPSGLLTTPLLMSLALLPRLSLALLPVPSPRFCCTKYHKTKT